MSAALQLLPEPEAPPVSAVCAWCGGEKAEPVKKSLRQEVAADPFCSSECCRAWYGLPPHTRAPQGKRAYV